MTYVSSGWPVHKPIPGGAPARAHSVKLALKLRTDVLAGVPLFAGLSKRQLQDVARGCLSRRWPSECRVVPEDTKSQVCYIIVEGTADVSRHGRTIAQLGPGEFFGEVALFDPGPRSATVTTTSEMTSVELSRQSFLGVAGDNPAILLRMLEALARRLRETTDKLTY
ncbi:MAG: cyclic nucleotide-binding domain-containing protein [Ilumatobacteraceae bacterium]